MNDPVAVNTSHADYGLDAPGVIRTMSVCGIAAIVIALVVGRLVTGVVILANVAIVPTLLWMGWALIAGSLLMVASSRWGKLRARDNLLDRMALTGRHVKTYAKDLRAAGMADVQLHGFTPWIYPPTRVLTAKS